MPGSVCGAAQPIVLQGNMAIVASTRFPGTPLVHVSEQTVVYGNLNNAGQREAALDVWCDNGGGTADGELANALVIYSADSGTLQTLGVLMPTQKAAANAPHVPFFDASPGGITLAPGTITVHEVGYAANDPTCCPSIMTTTVWTYANSVFTPSSH